MKGSKLLEQLFLEMGDAQTARRYFEQHLEIDTRLCFSLGTVIALGDLGNLGRCLGDYTPAESFYEQCLTQSRLFGL